MLHAVTEVIQDPLHFKYKLDIGEDAYQNLRLKKYLLDAVDAGNGAIVGFGAAKSSLVASTFFAPSGLLGAIGVGTAATPVGWAIAAGVVGAGLSLVIGKQLIRGSSDKVREIPECINTPMDILAVGLFDLIGMLSVKLAQVDGNFDQSEQQRIQRYFVEEWGYAEEFVQAGLLGLEQAAKDHTIQGVAEQLAEFKKQNPDCNYETMAKEIVMFLHELSEVDGHVDEREQLAIEKIEAIFVEANSLKVGEIIAETVEVVGDAGKQVANNVGQVVSKVSDAARKAVQGEDNSKKN